MSDAKGVHEAFAQFFESPSRPALRKLLQQNVGEFNHLDFKEEWVAGPKLARHILAFANHGGGALVVGMREESDKTLTASGISAFKDKTDIFNSIKKFVADSLKVEVLDFSFEETEYAAIKGRKFQVTLVNDCPSYLPFVCTSDGDGIREGAVYVRDGVATTEASHDQLQRIINRRISTGHSTRHAMTLRDHLDELQILYNAVEKTSSNPIYQLATVSSLLSVRNPHYPEESMDAFVARLIEQKKRVVQAIIKNPQKE